MKLAISQEAILSIIEAKTKNMLKMIHSLGNLTETVVQFAVKTNGKSVFPAVNIYISESRHGKETS